MNAFTRQDELTLHVGSECMGFFGLVRSRRDADACTHALLLDSGFSAFPRCGRTLIPGLGFTQALRMRSGRGFGGYNY